MSTALMAAPAEKGDLKRNGMKDVSESSAPKWPNISDLVQHARSAQRGFIDYVTSEYKKSNLDTSEVRARFELHVACVIS